MEFKTGLSAYAYTGLTGVLYNAENGELKEYKLPAFFGFPVRKDLIKRVYYAEFTAGLQPKGRDPLAGKRTTAESWGAHHGVSRVPRIKGTSRAAFVNMTVGGHLAHPPRVEKVIKERVNKKERVLGTLSALSATAVPSMVRSRGHVFKPGSLPIIIPASLEDEIVKVKDSVELFKKIGVYEDIVRSYNSIRIRAGKGKRRGRKYKERKSVLLIVSNASKPLAKATRNLPGVDVSTGWTVNVLQLAPGAVPGRLTVTSESALKQLAHRFGGVI
ncbi:MAG: 50S ribosomal protein L4 [Desulfurococcales archaeon]|nr:50S ribosomal protein L4 [Desulfurococcales archaeon]